MSVPISNQTSARQSMPGRKTVTNAELLRKVANDWGKKAPTYDNLNINHMTAIGGLIRAAQSGFGITNHHLREFLYDFDIDLDNNADVIAYHKSICPDCKNGVCTELLSLGN